MNKVVSNLLNKKVKKSVGVQLTNEQLKDVSGGYQHQEHARHIHGRMNHLRG